MKEIRDDDGNSGITTNSASGPTTDSTLTDWARERSKHLYNLDREVVEARGEAALLEAMSKQREQDEALLRECAEVLETRLNDFNRFQTQTLRDRIAARLTDKKVAGEGGEGA
jgi:hypothetical protein